MPKKPPPPPRVPPPRDVAAQSDGWGALAVVALLCTVLFGAAILFDLPTQESAKKMTADPQPPPPDAFVIAIPVQQSTPLSSDSGVAAHKETVPVVFSPISRTNDPDDPTTPGIWRELSRYPIPTPTEGAQMLIRGSRGSDGLHWAEKWNTPRWEGWRGPRLSKSTQRMNTEWRHRPGVYWFLVPPLPTESQQ